MAFLDAPVLEADLSGREDDVLHLRVELLEAPGAAPLRYQLCLVPSDIAVSPACSPVDLLAFEGPGVASARLPWASLSGASRVDWRRGVDSVMVIARRGDGSPLAADGSGDGGTDAGLALDAYLPMRLRVQAVAVPPGTTFAGWR